MESLHLRDPDQFIVGGLHENVHAWEVILRGHPMEEFIRDWIRNKIDILNFAQPFSGLFKKAKYSSDVPPNEGSKEFRFRAA